MSDRKNIKIPPELFESLAEDKGQYQTWAGYLEENCLND